MYSRDTVIAVRPFTRQQDGDEVVIGNAETGVYLALPHEAVELLDLFAQSKTIGEVSDFYQKRYGETPDLHDFLGLLERKGMVAPVGAQTEDRPNISEIPRTLGRRYHFAKFPQTLARRIFGPPVLTGCILLISLALAAISLDRSVMPVPADLYFPDHRALTWTILLAAYYSTIFLHEMGHLVAARAVGISSRMGISHRLWYLVAETDLTGLWSVPKRQRYLPMLAGILVDAVSAALLILLLFTHRYQWLALSTFWIRLIRAMAFTYIMRTLWEFFLFVRTDIYYVIATLFSCRNLLGDTQAFLRNIVARIIPSVGSVEQGSISASESRMIRAYAVIWIVGRAWAIYALFWVAVPVGASYLSDVTRVLRAGYSINPANFADALILATYFLVPTVAGFVLWTHACLQKKRTRNA